MQRPHSENVINQNIYFYETSLTDLAGITKDWAKKAEVLLRRCSCVSCDCAFWTKHRWKSSGSRKRAETQETVAVEIAKRSIPAPRADLDPCPFSMQDYRGWRGTEAEACGGGSIGKCGYPSSWLVDLMENPIEIDNLGVPPFQEASMLICYYSPSSKVECLPVGCCTYGAASPWQSSWLPQFYVCLHSHSVSWYPRAVLWSSKTSSTSQQAILSTQGMINVNPGFTNP